MYNGLFEIKGKMKMNVINFDNDLKDYLLFVLSSVQNNHISSSWPENCDLQFND